MNTKKKKAMAMTRMPKTKKTLNMKYSTIHNKLKERIKNKRETLGMIFSKRKTLSSQCPQVLQIYKNKTSTILKTSLLRKLLTQQTLRRKEKVRRT